MKFVASRLSDGNKMFPVEIYIEETNLLVKFPKLLGSDTKAFSYGNIGVETIKNSIGFSTLIFTSPSNKAIAHGFKANEVKKIQEEISLRQINGGHNYQGITRREKVIQPAKENLLSKEKLTISRSKEEIDLEYYEREKKLELDKKKNEQLAYQQQIKFDDAKKYLENGGYKIIYFYKLLVAYLNTTSKKIVLLFILWLMYDAIIELFKK